jgi:hypothetical protein
MLTAHAVIDSCYTALIKKLKRINSTLDSLSPNKINWKPESKIWGAGDCINRLVITNDYISRR